MASKTTKRKRTEVPETSNPRFKRQQTLERQVRLRMATTDDDGFSKEAAEKTVFTQKSRSDAGTISKPDVSMIRPFVYDIGLVGGSQPQRLKELLEELGVDDDDEFAIQLKVKQKASNLNRTRREFMEMVAEDDMGDVRDRQLKFVVEFGKSLGGSSPDAERDSLAANHPLVRELLGNNVREATRLVSTSGQSFAAGCGILFPGRATSDGDPLGQRMEPLPW
jgi:hypothetical protein